MPLVKKTYHCKVIRLTNTKQVALQQDSVAEYDHSKLSPLKIPPLAVCYRRINGLNLILCKFKWKF